jgi:formate hydrogenlyase subunit 4
MLLEIVISSWFRPIGLTFAPLITIVQWLIVALGAPLLVGVIRKTKARLQGRRGAGVWQPYWNLRKLLIKEVVVSENTSWIFRLTPYVAIGTMLLSAFMVPVLTTAGPLQFLGNIILLMYVFLLSAFFLALAGLDAGSSFGGMGASREMAIAALAEPTVMIGIFAIALRAGSTGLNEMISRSVSDPLLLLNPGHLLAFSSFFIVAIAETGRLPVDNPSTHLELTMIHEAMILEYSGRYLALIEWASAIKLFLFLTLLGNIFFPWGIAVTLQPGALIIGVFTFVIKLGVLAVSVAVLETSVAKLRLFRVPELLTGSFMLALLAVVSFFFLR